MLPILVDNIDDHFDLRYPFTSERELSKKAENFKCEYAYTEAHDSISGYFPSIAMPVWYIIKLKHYIWKKPSSLTHMIGRFKKES